MSPHVDIPEFPDQTAFVQRAGGFPQSENAFSVGKGKDYARLSAPGIGLAPGSPEKFQAMSVGNLPTPIGKIEAKSSPVSQHTEMVPCFLNGRFDRRPIRLCHCP